MQTTCEARELAIEVAHNVRHLAGLRTRDGRTTTARDVVRAASLHRLLPAGIGTLADGGIRTVIDLRSQFERERDVTPDLARFGMTTVFAPVFEMDASPVGQTPGDFPGYAEVYRRMLERGRAAYRCLVETVADAEGGVLFHCAAGKDRTGVGAALLLQVAGVRDEDIVDDYRVSAERLAPVLGEWLPRMKARGIDLEHATRLMASDAVEMEATLSHIRATWGTAEGYLLDIGVAPAAIGAVRARFVA